MFPAYPFFGCNYRMRRANKAAKMAADTFFPVQNRLAFFI